MKIEFAPPGTDPTRIPSSPPRMGTEFVHDNWLLLVGIAIFAIMTIFKFLPAKEGTPVQQQAAVEVTVEAPRECIYLDAIVIPETETVRVGDYWVSCFNGIIGVGPKVATPPVP